MRAIILPIVLIIVQLLTYGLVLALQWLLRPYVALPSRWLLIGCFVGSNLLLAVGFMGLFRLSTAWLAALWLGLLSAGVAWGLIAGSRGLGISGVGYERLLALASFVALVGFSVYNAYSPTVRYLTVAIDKPLAVPIRVAVASDLHLGALFGTRELKKLGDIVQQNQVDILLLPGDIMDDDTTGFERAAMATQFKEALSAAPITAVSLGNHDLYRTSAYASITQAITATGALLLDDKVETVAINKEGQQVRVQLAGRFDDHNTARLTTKALLADSDTSLPVILLDHRPSEIDSNSQLPIDLQVSGHTHNGQVFPANFIVQAINRVGYGYDNINGMHVVVSSGFGFWGIPLRLGSQSEVWVIDIVGR